MKGKLLYGALGLVFLLNAILIWKAINQESTFPDYLSKPINNSSDLVEQEQIEEPTIQEVKTQKTKVEEPTSEPAVQEIKLKESIKSFKGENLVIVESGQTLAGLSRKYQVSVAELKAANGLTSDVLQVGKTLKIPSSTNKSNEPQVSNLEGEFHEVQPGETLNKIAKKYELDVEKIKEANKLEDDKINVGQKLKIPK